MEGMNASPIGSRDCDSGIVKGRRLYPGRPSVSFIQIPRVVWKCHQTVQSHIDISRTNPAFANRRLSKLTTSLYPRKRQRRNECSRSRHVLSSAIFSFLLALLPSRYQLVYADHSRETIVPPWMPRTSGEAVGLGVKKSFSRPVPAEFFWSHHSWGWCLWTTPPAGSSKSLKTQPKARQFLPCAEVPRLQLTVDIFNAKERGSIPRELQPFQWFRRYGGVLHFLAHVQFRILKSQNRASSSDSAGR